MKTRKTFIAAAIVAVLSCSAAHAQVLGGSVGGAANGALGGGIGNSSVFGGGNAAGSFGGELDTGSMIHRTRGAQAKRFVKHLVVPAGFVVRVQEDVRVSLYQAGQQGHPGEGDSGCAGHPDALHRAHRVDTIPTHAHAPSRVSRLTVEHLRRLQDRHLWWSLRVCGQLREENGG